MSIPLRFIVGLAAGLLLAVSVFVAFLYTQLGVPTHMSEWIFDISQKKERLAAQVSGPRLLLVAGSSALFSFNAELIEKETGYPTINMGTHAGLCLDYRLYRIRKIARPGDIVLIACEYEFYENGIANYSEWNDDYVLARDPDYFYQMPLLDKIDMATRIDFKRLQTGWRRRDVHYHERPLGGPPYSVYTPIVPGIDCLDDHGDEVFNTSAARAPSKLGGGERLVPTLVDGLPSTDTLGFNLLAAFFRWAQANRVTVLATFPAITHQPVYDQPKGKQAIQTITRFYADHGVPVIGTAEEAMLPSDQFFDTMYHLTHEAALTRTERFIPELRSYLHPSK